LTETAARPPGRSTRRNSDRPCIGSEKNISPRLHSTASKFSSKNESACPSSTETETFGALLRRSRAFSAMAGETSAAVTWPVGPTAARAASAESPVPVAMSRTRIPGARWAARNRKGMKCAVTCAKARSYSVAASSLKASSSAIPTSESLSFVLRMKCSQSRIVHCKLRAYYLVDLRYCCVRPQWGRKRRSRREG
jgi:hypothetical protein